MKYIYIYIFNCVVFVMTFSVHIQCSRPTPYTLTLIAPYFQVRTPQVMLDLDMPSQFTEMPAFRTRDSTFQRFGFDLRTSNKLPLNRACSLLLMYYDARSDFTSQNVVLLHLPL